MTAEYAMLPRATLTRSKRESSAGKVSGRSQEIQRLIGRSLRAVVDLPRLGERTEAPNRLRCPAGRTGTRTASITGAWIALHDCLRWMTQRSILRETPLKDHVAAISCGVVGGEVVAICYSSSRIARSTTAQFGVPRVTNGSGLAIVRTFRWNSQEPMPRPISVRAVEEESELALLAES